MGVCPRMPRRLNFSSAPARLLNLTSVWVCRSRQQIYHLAISKADLGLVLHARLHLHRDTIRATVGLQKRSVGYFTRRRSSAAIGPIVCSRISLDPNCCTSSDKGRILYWFQRAHGSTCSLRQFNNTIEEGDLPQCFWRRPLRDREEQIMHCCTTLWLLRAWRIISHGYPTHIAFRSTVPG